MEPMEKPPNGAAETGPAQNEQEVKLPISQSPGDFFLFWNVIVPLSVLFNIRRFGLRCHEVGLIIALLLNPFILGFLVKHPFLSWLVVIFLIIWIERILTRWAWYRIYTFSFFRNILLFVLFISLPSLAVKYLWHPFYQSIPRALHRVDSKLTEAQGETYRNITVLVLAVLMLLHALYTYTVYDGVNISLRGRVNQINCASNFFCPAKYKRVPRRRCRRRAASKTYCCDNS